MSDKLVLHKIKLPRKIKYQKLVIILPGIFLVVFLLLYLMDRQGILTKIFRNYQRIDSSFVLLEPENTKKGLESVIDLLPTPPIPRDKENPINGVMMTKAEYAELITRHPIAITVNNLVPARPQHGLSKADTVLEVLSEGGITRYVPIFYQNYDVAKVGPVRSLRYYMIEFASGYGDAVILHHGWAGFDGNPWETYREKTDARGAVFKLGIKSLQTAASTYRDKDKAKSAGYVHSLYTDFTRINAELKRMQGTWKLGGEVVTPLTFKYDEDFEKRGDFKSVTIQFLSLSKNDYTAKFVYNKENNEYERYIANKPDIDLVTGAQITPKNVIIEWHNYGDARDGHNRIIIDMIGEDKVVVLRDGLKLAGKWKKECRTCRTKYYNEDGSEIALVRGQIWIVNAVKVGDRSVSNVTYE